MHVWILTELCGRKRYVVGGDRGCFEETGMVEQPGPQGIFYCIVMSHLSLSITCILDMAFPRHHST